MCIRDQVTNSEPPAAVAVKPISSGVGDSAWVEQSPLVAPAVIVQATGSPALPPVTSPSPVPAPSIVIAAAASMSKVAVTVPDWLSVQAPSQGVTVQVPRTQSPTQRRYE